MFLLMCSHILNLQIHAELYTFLDPKKQVILLYVLHTSHPLSSDLSVYMQITLCCFHKCYTSIYRLYIYNMGGAGQKI